LRDDPYLLVSTVLEAICHALPKDQRLRVASELREIAVGMNECAENAAHQELAADIASLAALAEHGPDAALDILNATLPRV
jgi:hypothetical protein